MDLPKFHQVAIYSDTHDDTVDFYKLLGAEEWIEDQSNLVGHVNEQPSEVRLFARKSFNYTYLRDSLELEVLTFEGPSHHHVGGRAESFVPFLSHMAAYSDDALSIGQFYAKKFGTVICANFLSYDHTSAIMIERRLRFREVIVDMRKYVGYDFKFIQKMAADE